MNLFHVEIEKKRKTLAIQTESGTKICTYFKGEKQKPKKKFNICHSSNTPAPTNF